MPKKKQISTPEQEYQRFLAAAKEHGCDESPEAFTETVKALAKMPAVTNKDVQRKAKKKLKP